MDFLLSPAPDSHCACLQRWCGGNAHCPSAQDYPSRPVRMIVPQAAAAVRCVCARSVSDERGWGQPVIIDNRAGAAKSLAPVQSLSRHPMATRCSSRSKARRRSTRHCLRL